MLTRAKKHGEILPAGDDLLIPVDDLRIFVRAKCTSAAQQSNVKQAVAKAHHFSWMEYLATHSALTGLPNRRSFDLMFTSDIEQSVGGLSNGSCANNLEALAPITVSVLAIDLDNFKQVNDTHGHAYGDIVLKALAQRMRQHLDASLRPLNIKYQLGHMSGEEFNVYLIGSLTQPHVLKIANALRQAVANRPLPSAAEVAAVAPRGQRRPPLLKSERRHTISVGVETAEIPRSLQDTAGLISRLMKSADLAMLRAKKQPNKNVVHSFSDIRLRLGRVLEHDRVNDLIAIDIGRDVGVSEGDEFAVYDPKNAEKRPVVYSDGRTSTPIGSYPKVSCATIAALHVHNQMSFCTFVNRIVPWVEIQRDFVLETLAHGALPKALCSTATAAGIANIADLTKTLKDISPAAAKALVFALRNIDRTLATRGEMGTQESLRHLYDILQSLRLPSTSVGMLSSTEIAIVGTFAPTPLAVKVLRALDRAGDGDVLWSVGAFDAKRYTKNGPRDVTAFRSENILALARYAAVAAEEPNTVTFFSPRVAQRVLRSSRLSSRFDDTVSDFFNMQSLGMEDGLLYHEMSLLYSQAEAPFKHLERAFEYAKRAESLRPQDPSIHVQARLLEDVLHSGKSPAEINNIYASRLSAAGMTGDTYSLL